MEDEGHEHQSRHGLCDFSAVVDLEDLPMSSARAGGEANTETRWNQRIAIREKIHGERLARNVRGLSG